jgi:hypothetical protein
MSDEDARIRKAVKMLLRVSKLFQARAMSREEALKMVIRLPSASRASLSGNDVENLLQEARKIADEIISKSTAQLEQSLETGTHWLADLEAYTSSLLKDE